MKPAKTLEGEELPDEKVYGLVLAMEPAIVSTNYMGKAGGAGVLDCPGLQTSQPVDDNTG